MSILPGPEPLTRKRLAQRGQVLIRDPKTGHGIVTSPHTLKTMRERGHPMAGDPGPHEQQSLFSEDEIKRPPHHALSPHQFAAQHDVWWHGKYGEDIASDSYKEGHEHFGEEYESDYDEETGEYDEKSGYQGIHFGTRKAAEDRLKALGPGRAQDEEEAWERKRAGEPERVPGRFFPVTLNKDMMQDRIRSDAGHDWREHMGFDEPADEGVLYENSSEDPGAISATVPERMNRHGHFFKTWNDHVIEAHDAGGEVHPMLLDYARKAPEHTGEDWSHPDEHKYALTTPGAPEQGALFQHYGSRYTAPKYLDTHHKNTLGENIKTTPRPSLVPSKTIQHKFKPV